MQHVRLASENATNRKDSGVEMLLGRGRASSRRGDSPHDINHLRTARPWRERTIRDDHDSEFSLESHASASGRQRVFLSSAEQ